MQPGSQTLFRGSILPIALFVFLAICLMTGGGSRADSPQQIVVRLAAIVLGCMAAVAIDREGVRRLAMPLALLSALAVLIVLQLVPLPPALWMALPGRSLFVEAAGSAGLAQPWRPLSVTPDLSLNSLVALIPAIAVLLALAVVPQRTSTQLLLVWIAAAVASALLGLLQLAGGIQSPFYTFSITSFGDPVGFFANRNHQALFLATALPLTMIWGASSADTVAWPNPMPRAWLALAIVVLLLLVLLVSGSRQGLAFALVGVLGGLLLIRERWGAILQNFGSLRKRLAGGAVLVAVAIMMVAIARSRTTTLDRLVEGDGPEELRVANLPATLQLAREYFPFGSGFGSFDPVFRIVESDGSLTPKYFNHAHNDLVELAITGGVPAMLILLGFLAWWLMAIRRLAPVAERSAHEARLGRAGALLIGMMLAASLVDYPLRTPMVSVFFAIAVVWLIQASDARFTGNGAAVMGTPAGRELYE